MSSKKTIKKLNLQCLDVLMKFLTVEDLENYETQVFNKVIEKKLWKVSDNNSLLDYYFSVNNKEELKEKIVNETLFKTMWCVDDKIYPTTYGGDCIICNVKGNIRHYHDKLTHEQWLILLDYDLNREGPLFKCKKLHNLENF